MKLILAGAGLAVLIAAPVLAQDAPPPPPPAGYDRPTPMTPPTRPQVEAMVAKHFAELDADHDGFVTRAEFDAFAAARRAERESRKMSPDGGPEHRAMHAPGGMGAGMMMNGARWFDRADADHDGKVTLPEAQSTALAMFDRLDTDHDGTISRDEMKAMWMRGSGHGPNGDMPPPPPPER